MAADLSHISAPYNFVPLADWVHLPEWAARISHDIPFRDGLSGHLDLDIKADKPLLVGSEPQKATGSAAGRVEPYRLPDGRWAIPGTALKGMIRAVVEIATFSRMSAVDDVRFGLRDISGPYVKDAYATRVRDKMQTGFMRRADDGRAVVAPCRMVRLDHRALEQWLGLREAAFRVADRSVAKKYVTWRNHCAKAAKDPDRMRFTPGDRDATALGTGTTEGVPVFTGQISESTKRGGKRRDFVFFDERDGEAFALDPQDWNDFLFVHGDQATRDAEGMSWPGYWKERYWRGEAVPVFYLRDGGKTRVGLAYMPRLATDFSIHQMRDHTSPEHGRGEGRGAWDFAEAVFGTVGESPDACLKGRVTFQHAVATDTPTPQAQAPTILNGPKASYFPNYLEQSAGSDGRLQPNATYATGLATREHPSPALRGWKRYPARPEAQVQALTAEQRDNKNVQVILNPLPPGTRFTTRMRFHNLRAEELGAVVWALTWGGMPDLRHSLGMGKPFGFGQVTVTIAGADIVPNRRGGPSPSWGDASDRFVAYMDEQHRLAKTVSWRASAQIRALLGMADPAKAGEFKGGLRHMRLEAKGKINEFTDAKKVPLALAAYPSGEHPPTRTELKAQQEAAEREARKTPEDREIEKLEQLFEKTKALRQSNPGGPLGGRFNSIIADAQAWPPDRRERLVTLLEQISQFMDGDKKKRRARIETLRSPT